jgi:hypothetical protein
MRWPWWTARHVRHVHAAGLLAFGYDAQRPWTLRRCGRIGLDGVFSDHVDRMLVLTLAAPPRFPHGEYPKRDSRDRGDGGGAGHDEDDEP